MNPDRIASELGAQVRRFKTVSGALLWYVEQRGRRMGKSIPLEGGGGPLSQERVDQVAATFARIAVCLVVWDREHDDDENPLGTPEQTERRFEELLTWIRTSSKKGAAGGDLVASNRAHRRQAADLGMGAAAASRYFAYVEGVIRRRMKARGLLVLQDDCVESIRRPG